MTLHKLVLIYFRSNMKKLLIFSALACMIRPTNAVIWLYLFGNLFWVLRFNRHIAKTVIFQAVVVG